MVKHCAFGILLGKTRADAILRSYHLDNFKEFGDIFEEMLGVLWHRSRSRPWLMREFALDIFGPILREIVARVEADR